MSSHVSNSSLQRWNERKIVLLNKDEMRKYNRLKRQRRNLTLRGSVSVCVLWEERIQVLNLEPPVGWTDQEVDDTSHPSFQDSLVLKKAVLLVVHSSFNILLIIGMTSCLS